MRLLGNPRSRFGRFMIANGVSLAGFLFSLGLLYTVVAAQPDLHGWVGRVLPILAILLAAAFGTRLYAGVLGREQRGRRGWIVSVRERLVSSSAAQYACGLIDRAVGGQDIVVFNMDPMSRWLAPGRAVYTSRRRLRGARGSNASRYVVRLRAVSDPVKLPGPAVVAGLVACSVARAYSWQRRLHEAARDVALVSVAVLLVLLVIPMVDHRGPAPVVIRLPGAFVGFVAGMLFWWVVGACYMRFRGITAEDMQAGRWVGLIAVFTMLEGERRHQAGLPWWRRGLRRLRLAYTGDERADAGWRCRAMLAADTDRELPHPDEDDGDDGDGDDGDDPGGE